MIKGKNFYEIVEEIKLLDREEKEELKSLIEKYIIEEKREKILKNYKKSFKELKEGKLEFSGDLNKLKQELSVKWMVKVSFSSSFKKAFQKRIEGNKSKEKKFFKKLEKFMEDPFDKSLKTHKLSGKLKDIWSFSIDYNIRVLFFFVEENKVVFLI